MEREHFCLDGFPEWKASILDHSSPFSPQGSRPGAGAGPLGVGAPIHNEKRGADFRFCSTVFLRSPSRALALRKFFSTLLKTPFKAASKLGNNFTEPKTAIHTCSQCSHNHFLQVQQESTPALHRISHRFFPCISHVVVLDVQFGQDRVDLQRLRDRDGSLWTDVDVVEP